MDTKLSVFIMLFMVFTMLAVFTATNYSPNLLPNANATGADNPFTYSTTSINVIIVSGNSPNNTSSGTSWVTQLSNDISYLQCSIINFGTNVNCNGSTSLTQLAQSPFGISSIGSNSIFYSITSNPLATAGTIAGVFIGLGILAGVLGAGTLANIMASVGIALSVNAYFALEELQFSGMPLPAVLLFNGFIAVVSLWLIWEAFGK